MSLTKVFEIALAALLLAACTVGPGGQKSEAPGGQQTAVPPAAPAPTATSATATPDAPTANTEQPTATPTASQATATLPVPPKTPPPGLLTFEGTTVEGKLGSWCLFDRCVDYAEPYFQTLPDLEAPGDTLEFELRGRVQFVGYSAYYWVDGEPEVIKHVPGPDPDAGDHGTPITSAEFSTPPAGEWIVTVFVQFGPGDASYSWRVTVE
jgi:hypothetical protein